MDRVGPAHHQGGGLGPGPGDEDGDEPVTVAEEEVAGRAELEGQGEIEDVAARQPEVEVAASRSRGIEPEIDLTGPPEDAGVSHSHAALVSTPDGGWAVVDLGSSNGTYINDSTTPIAPNKPIPVKEGDQIHVGAWTTLTLLSG